MSRLVTSGRKNNDALSILERQTRNNMTRSFQVFFFPLDVSSLKSKGLVGIPTRVNTEDETLLGLQQARGGINHVVIPLVSLGLHGG